MGSDAHVGDWAIEKLCKVVEALAAANDVGSIEIEILADNALLEAYRNTAKLAAWMAGNVGAYNEDAAHEAYDEGADEMKRHIELLLSPVLS